MRIFNPDNGIFRYTEKLADLIILSVFWIVCSLPVVTVGASTAALYHTVVHCIRGNGRNSWGMFFLTFKSNLKVGTLTSLVVVPASVVLLLLYDLLYQAALVNSAGYVLYFAYRVFLLLPVGALCYLFPVLSRFTFQVNGLLVNSAKLAVAHLPSTVLMALILFAALVVCANILVFVFVMPTVVAWLHSYLLERIFKPYMDQQNPPKEELED